MTQERHLLDTIDGPDNLKGLEIDDLRQLAGEIREVLVETVTANGGHLASNLGTVELALALHSVFDSPRDKLVWDVGHQAYPHKLLTGRRDRFDTIRQLGGISGFLSRDESVHDAFGAGHAGTAISAALGMAVARDLRGTDEHVVAIVGDGAMTCGLAYEALDNAGARGKRLIVILNENSMSIAPNVGAISQHFFRSRTEPERGCALFGELGFEYLGPVDGHDLPTLLASIRRAREMRQPVVLHVVTVKGKGVPAAEADAVASHGVSPPSGPKPAKTPPAYTKVFADTLADLAERDARIIAITAAMPDGTGLAAFQKRFPDRTFDVGIAEAHAVTFAAGLAASGMKPVVAVYSTFLQRAYDSIVHDVCIQKLPVVFALDRAGLVGEDGRTHHGAFDLAYLRTLPNLTVMAPRDEAELQRMLVTALAQDGPVAIRYPRGAGVGVPLSKAPSTVEVGRAEVLRTGGDLAFVAIGSMVGPALEAADLLERLGVDATVVDARFVKPLDGATLLGAAREARRIVTVEENVLAGGFGSAVLELLAERGESGVRVIRLGLPDSFVEHGSPEELHELCGLTPSGICDSVLAAFPELAGAAVRGNRQ